MTRGVKKHLKRLNAPSHWMLDKLGGIFVSHLSPRLLESLRWVQLWITRWQASCFQPCVQCAAWAGRTGLSTLVSDTPLRLPQAHKPTPGPHKQQECVPLAILIRNRLKYAPLLVLFISPRPRSEAAA